MRTFDVGGFPEGCSPAAEGAGLLNASSQMRPPATAAPPTPSAILPTSAWVWPLLAFWTSESLGQANLPPPWSVQFFCADFTAPRPTGSRMAPAMAAAPPTPTVTQGAAPKGFTDGGGTALAVVVG